MAWCTGILTGTSSRSPSRNPTLRPIPAISRGGLLYSHDRSTRTEPQGFEPFERPAPISGAPSPTPCPRTIRPTQPGWERATLEKLAFASLREQRATRRWKTFVRLSWLAFFIFLAWLGAVARRAAARRPRRAHRRGRDQGRDRQRRGCERRVRRRRHEDRLRGRRRQGRGAAHQLAGRQPGAGRHHQRRDHAA